MKLQLVVEGDGDLSAVPVLVRKILHFHQRFDVELLRPHVRGDLAKVLSNFSRYLQVALLEGAPVIWTMDCDDDIACPVSHVETIRVAITRSGVHIPRPIEFCFFVKEFEGMFLAEEVTARQELGISASTPFPADAEAVRGAKECLSRMMRPGSAYKPSVHQARIAANLDLAQLRQRSRSFRHLESAVLRVIN